MNLSISLADLLIGLSGVALHGAAALTGARVAEVRDDSRLVRPGDLFVAVPGATEDGRRFIDEALHRGAAVILAEGPVRTDVGWVSAPDARRALGIIAANRFASAAALELTGLTGTNGKTTTTYLVESMLMAAGRRPGVIGTVSNRFAGHEQTASLTTPGALALHALFAEMKAAHCTDAVLETSSHALAQGRLSGCRFKVAALTNVTQDHLDYHGTMENYSAAKAILFRELMAPGIGVSVLFADREDGRQMRRHVSGPLLTVATQTETRADVVVGKRRLHGAGTEATFHTPAGDIEIVSSLVGGFNLSNLALAVGIGIGHGLPVGAIAEGLRFVEVPGRLQRVANPVGALCVVDYAHTPDALQRAIEALRPLTVGRLVVLFGCGGDRDRVKRPLMGAIAAALADLVIVTSDNPRTESPTAIISMILDGIRPAGCPLVGAEDLIAAKVGYHVESDRRTAISIAVAALQPGDTLLVAGKGHEDYQVVGTTKIHFDDREEVAAAFALRPGSLSPGKKEGPGL